MNRCLYLSFAVCAFLSVFLPQIVHGDLIRLYPDEGKGGATSDGRTFEDRFTDWLASVNSTEARIASSDDSNSQDLSNSLGNGFGPNHYALNRLHFSFDTSLIPDGVDIESATFNFFGKAPDLSSGSERGIYLVESNPIDPGNLMRGDFSTVGDISFGVTDGSWNTDAVNTIELNSEGLDSLNRNGITTFALRGWYDFNEEAPDNSNELYVHVYFSEAVGTEFDPYLEVTYTYEEVAGIPVLLTELIQDIADSDLGTNVVNSYLANLKKVEDFRANDQKIAAENQLLMFLKKLEHDKDTGKIPTDTYEDYLDLANQILELILNVNVRTTPLITQVVSEYPSIAETSAWADAAYAGGRADQPGDCGLTIAQCGCVLSSLSMLGWFHGITSGSDGSTVNPLNMNDWLLEETDGRGFDAAGNIMWPWALAYLGEEKNGKHMSHLYLEELGSTDSARIRNFISGIGPALGFSSAKGHWVLLTGLTSAGYFLNDPFWYNTKTSNDVRTDPVTIQDYNDIIGKSTLIGHREALMPIQEIVHVSVASPAHLLITDESGRRTGYDPVYEKHYNEIPNAYYDPAHVIVDQANPSAEPHATKHLVLIEPEGENFELEVIGTAVGDYQLTMAVSDGAGSLFGESVTDITEFGEIDNHTLITDAETNSLPQYLKDILYLIPPEDHPKFIQAFKVIVLQLGKEHTIPTVKLIENLVRYLENNYAEETWYGAVREQLLALP